MKKNPIADELAQETLRELYGKQRESKGKPLTSPKLPFRIPVIERTTRQAQSLQGYKASAHWQTAMLLHDLLFLWTATLPVWERRRREQIESAIRSVVSTIEEGWARPSTKEYLDFIGFAQGSLAEIRGDVERAASKGLLKTAGNYGKLHIPTPSRNFPYPPVNSRTKPTGIEGRLREYTGKEINPQDLTYEIFIELVNKTDYLLRRTVAGLQEKVIKEEKAKLIDQLDANIRKYR